MSVMFRPAVRENVGLIIGLAGPSGSGKTYTAMRLAKGISGDKPFACIDTEGGRAKHYADAFRFDHADLTEPFTPERYSDVIELADKAGYPAIVVDNVSHEWAGEGGVMDMQEAEFERLGRRDTTLMTSWIAPKKKHKRMIQKLLKCRAHLILCMRAEEKIEMVKGADGKIKVVPKQGTGGFRGWLPICEKNLPYELIVSFLLSPENPGVPIPIKPLQEQLRPFFPLDVPITEDSGAKIAAWAAGGKPPERARTAQETGGAPAVLTSLREIALTGRPALRRAWEELTPELQDALRPELESLKKAALQADLPSQA